MGANRQLQQLVPRGEVTWLGYFVAQTVLGISLVGVHHALIFYQDASGQHNKVEKQRVIREASMYTNVGNVFVFPLLFPLILVGVYQAKNNADLAGVVFLFCEVFAVVPQGVYLWYLLKQVDKMDAASQEEKNPLSGPADAINMPKQTHVQELAVGNVGTAIPAAVTFEAPAQLTEVPSNTELDKQDPSIQELKQLFWRYDLDSSGLIDSAEELEQLSMAAAWKLSFQKWDFLRTLPEAVEEKRGKVETTGMDFNEFQHWWHQIVQASRENCSI